MPLHRHLTRDGARRLFPSLRADAVTGAIRYFDGQVDDARLVVTLARTAASLGAAVVTSARVVGFAAGGPRGRSASGSATWRRRDAPSSRCGPAPSSPPPACGATTCPRCSATSGVRPGLRVRASQGRAPGGAPLGDHRRGRADPAYARRRCCSSSRGAGTGSSAPPTPTGSSTGPTRRPRPATSTTCCDQVNTGAGPAADDRRHRGRVRRAAPAAVRRGRRHLEAVPRARGGRADARADAGRRRQVHDVPGDGRRRGRPGRRAGSVAARAAVAHRRSCRCSAPTDSPATWRDRAGPGPPARRHRPAWSSTCWSGTARSPATCWRWSTADPTLATPLAGAPEYLAAEVAYAAQAEGALHLDDVLTRRTRISIETAAPRRASRRGTPPQVMGGVLGWDDGHPRTARSSTTWPGSRPSGESQRMPDDLTADAARLGAPDVRGFAADRGLEIPTARSPRRPDRNRGLPIPGTAQRGAVLRSCRG